MRSAKLYEILDKKILIKFQSSVDIETFEILLKQCYSKTFSKKIQTIEFALQYVTWFEPFQLSIFALWISELLYQNRKIIINLPTNTRVLTFLNAYGFFKFLDEKKIEYNKVSISGNFKLSSKLPFFPLTFANSESFQNYLKNLSLDEYYNVIFDEVRHAAVSKRGIIRDIVLKEIGDNMYTHADGRFSNFIVSRHNIARLKYDKTYSPFEEGFFKQLKSSAYIEVILSDKGPGIVKTLLKSYEKERGERIKIDACEIIEYSTLEHTTSRSKKDRLKDLVNKLSNDIEDLSPFTGLFHIKETVRRYNGLLTIRSGASLVSFYSDKNNDYVVKSCSTKGFQKLSNIGGTQIKIVLPVYEELDFKLNERIIFNLNEVNQLINFDYLRVGSFFSSTLKKSIDEKDAEDYSVLIERIKHICELEQKTGLIIDFFGRSKLDVKMIFLLISQIMVYQRRYHNIVFAIINLNESIISILNDAFELKKDFIKTPLVVFDPTFQRHIIGLSKEEKKTFNEIIQAKEINSDTQEDFGIKYLHLFAVTRDSKNFELRHNRYQILSAALTHLKEKLVDIINEKSNNFHIQDIKVLTPSGKYATEYFQLFDLFASHKWSEILFNYFSIFIFINKPQLIISVGDYCGRFIDEFLNSIQPSKRKIDHYTITSLNYESHLSYLNSKSINKKVLIFTDVIGSGKTLKSIINGIIELDEVIIFACINLSGITSLKLSTQSKIVDINALMYKQYQQYNTLPLSWSYEDVYIFDKYTFKLKKSNALTDNVSTFKITDSLKPYTIRKVRIDNQEVYVNGFLEQIVIPNRAFYHKVFYGNIYMPIMFNTSLIFEILGDSISSDLLNTIFELEYNHNTKIAALVHLDYENAPFSILKKSLLKNYPSIEMLSLHPNHLEVPNLEDDSFSNKTVIILDNALTTGETLYKLIDYCETKSAKFILCYILIRRSNDFVLRNFQKIKRYGKSTIFFKYLFDAQIQIYKGHNNAFNNYLSELKRLNSYLIETEITSFLNILFDQYQYSHVYDTAIFNKSVDVDPKIVLWRWRLEIAKSNLRFRKEISLLFDDYRNILEIVIVFGILEHEQHLFLKDDTIRANIFYDSLKEKVLNTCKHILTNCLDDLSEYQTFATETVFLYLDEKSFFTFIEEVNNEILTNSKFFFSYLVLLSIYQNNLQKNHDRFILLDRLKEENKEKANTTLIRKIEKLWKTENEEIFVSLARKKIYEVKNILKTNFHDLQKLIEHVTENKNTLDKSEFRQFWDRIQSICRTAIIAYELFFSGNFYALIKERAFPLLKDLNDRINYGNNVIDNDVDYKEKITYVLNSIDNLVFNGDSMEWDESLLELIENNFRIDLKASLRLLVDKLREEGFEVSTDDITPKPCNVFCTSVDITTIMLNIQSNIIKHSTGRDIYIKAIKEKRYDENIIKIEIWNNGNNENKFIEIGTGLQNCESSISIYSGTFDFKFEHLVFANKTYTARTQIVLHDLSEEILKSSKNA